MIKYVPEKCKRGNECALSGFRCLQNDAVRKNKNAPRYICARPFDPRMVGIIKKWNKLTEKRRQVDEFTLKGIKHWRVFRFELKPAYKALESRKVAIKEGVTLLKEGFKLGYNTESGTGSLLPKRRGYVISSWVYGCNSVDKEILTAEQAVEWLIERTHE